MYRMAQCRSPQLGDGIHSIRDSAERSWHNETRLWTRDQARTGLMSRDTNREGFRATLVWRGSRVETLKDVPPQPDGILLVGINPSPPSVQAGHYYQGRLGRRLWARLERLGLIVSATHGREDEAFADSGNGLTDIVKRPTARASDLDDEELAYGAALVQEKIRSWKPALILFSFQAAALRLLGKSAKAGRGPLCEGVPSFLFSGPYAPAEQTAKIDRELLRLLHDLRGTSPVPPSDRARPVVTESVSESTSANVSEAVLPGEAGILHSQRVTATDKTSGIIRFPKQAKILFPNTKSEVEIVLLGARVRGSYDPRTGPDRERSAVLRVGRDVLGTVRTNERLTVSRGAGGTVCLD